jgi:hypothetical protein
MTDGELPLWAVRLRDERIKRLWSQKVMAARLRKAADERTLPLLPSQASIQRYVRWYEAGDHHPGDLYGELYCRVFGLTRDALFGTSPVAGQVTGRLPTEHDAIDMTSWITATNTSDDAIERFLRRASELAEAHTRLPAGELLPDVIGHHAGRGTQRGSRPGLWCRTGRDPSRDGPGRRRRSSAVDTTRDLGVQHSSPVGSPHHHCPGMRATGL